MIPGNCLPGKRGGAGYLQKVQKNAVLRVFEIVWGDLPGHIHRNPAFKPQHHFVKGAVNIVYLVQMQPLFQHHGHAEHPFFCEVLVLGHLLHRHIAVHYYGLVRFGKYGGLKKIQLAFHHFRYAFVGFAGRQLKGHGRNLELVETDYVYIFIKIKFIKAVKEF